MIRFEHLSKSFRVGHYHRKVIVEDLCLTLPTGKSLALMGRNGAGKSTLLEMVAGTIRPDSGRIVTDGTISWPVGLGGSLHKDLTGAQNIRFIARVYGVDTESLIAFVEDFAELGPHFHMPVRSYSSGMRSRLAFGASMGIRFDTYLVDETTAVGDASFRRKSSAVFRERMKQSSAIFVSHDLTQLREYCDAAILLEKGHLTYFDDLDEAIEVYQALMVR
ncbi:capsular polysaccharide transport system ATP-binding protein [Gemmobacter aquatilis]|uniref:Capsular polysaccharide transport system ATP-binding protein n=1 Tax=Gemmobacter aquatilis TaxID=933059 RepID=A0A1H8N242_9RHOB|nr:ABC transporter ATP-binding protein [Gemmobacter aquatilis]SEO23586.1 capsular polysaccharide transport system ATP-binding protein [Gemmobacter aquatilis]